MVNFDTIKKWKCFDAEAGKDPAVEIREYFIPDFSNWREHGAFEEAFKRLLRDLKAEELRPGPRLTTPSARTGRYHSGF